MSGIGKIFIILNLVFSLVIVGAAASYLSKADNWKQEYENVKGEFDNAKEDWSDQKSKFEAERSNLESEIDDKKSRIEDLEVQNGNLTDRVESQSVDNQQLRSAVDQIQANLDDFRQNMNDLQNRNNALADENASLRNDALDAQGKQRQAEDDKLRLEGDLARANQRISDIEVAMAGLDKKNGHLESLLNIAQSKGFDISSLEAMPEIAAKVLDVDNELGFVILSVGADDGVKKGWTFQVYRSEEYLGEVEVDEVYKKQCAAKIRFCAEGSEIKIQDNATTVL